MKRLDCSGMNAIAERGLKNSNRTRWDLGDELIRIVGRPIKEENGGAYEKLVTISEDMKEHGNEYEPLTLKNLRFAAWRFPPEERRPGIIWHAHYLAQTPEMLQTIIDGAPRNQKITQTYVLSVLRALTLDTQRRLDEETERRRVAAEEAQKELEQALEDERRAKTATAKKAARERADKASRKRRANLATPRKKDLPPSKPTADELPLMITQAAFVRDVGEVRRALKKLRETYEDLIPSFREVHIANGHDEVMAIAEEARSFASVLKVRSGRTSHLAVVKDAG